MEFRKIYLKKIKQIAENLNKTQDLIGLLTQKNSTLGLGGYGQNSPLSTKEILIYPEFEIMENNQLVDIGKGAVNFGISSHLFWNNWVEESSKRMELSVGERAVDEWWNDTLAVALSAGNVDPNVFNRKRFRRRFDDRFHKLLNKLFLQVKIFFFLNKKFSNFFSKGERNLIFFRL